MAKLLNTRLPLAVDDVDAPVFNRLVRILELNLNQFDPNSTPQFTDAQIGILNFNAGDVIWNTSIGVLQVYTGNKWVDLHTPVDPHGFEASAELGNISIKTNGDITLTL
jgi:hypothetical protein